MSQGRIVGGLARAAVGLGLVLLVPAAAAAQTPTTGEPGERPVATCTPGEPPTYERTCSQTVRMEPYTSPRSNWGPFLALLGWVLIPLCLAVYLADVRDESIVIAVVLTLVLGWIGLALVWAFLGRNRGHGVAPWTHP